MNHKKELLRGLPVSSNVYFFYSALYVYFFAFTAYFLFRFNFFLGLCSDRFYLFVKACFADCLSCKSEADGPKPQVCGLQRVRNVYFFCGHKKAY